MQPESRKQMILERICAKKRWIQTSPTHPLQWEAQLIFWCWCIRGLLRRLKPSVETRDARSELQLAFPLDNRDFLKHKTMYLPVDWLFFALLCRRWKQSSSSSDVCVIYVCASVCLCKNHSGVVYSWLSQSPEVASTGTQTPSDIRHVVQTQQADTLVHT